MTALKDVKNALFIIVDEGKLSKLLTAALSHKQVKAMDMAAHEAKSLLHGWDPKLHPRDTEGKFTFKGHGEATVAGKPIKINTAVIYKTKYQHGQVVAVKTQSGVTSEVRWNANEKAPGSGTKGRFEVWSDYGSPGLGLAQAKVYSKAQAYDALKNDSDWWTPSGPTIADMTDVLAAPPPKTDDSKFLSHYAALSGLDYNVAEINSYFHGMTVKKWESLSPNDKNNALHIAEGMYDYQGQESPKNILQGLYGQQLYEMQDEVQTQIEELLLPQNEDEAIAAIQAMNGPEFLQFIEDNMDELTAMWPSASEKEKNALLDKAKGLQTKPTEKGFPSGSYDYLKPWDLLTQVDNANQGSSVQPLGDTVSISAQIDHLSKNDFQTWLYDHIYPDAWDNGLTQAEQDHISSWAHVWGLDNVLSELIGGGTGNLDEHGLTEMQIQDFSGVVDAINSGLMNQPTLEKWIDNSLTPDLWKTLTPEQQFELNATTGHHGLLSKLHAKIGASLSSSTPTPQLPPSSSHAGSLTPNVYDTSAVGWVGYIGTPKNVVDASKYKYLTQQSAKKMQTDMLQQAGKTWTAQELSAVSGYTTSVGYQTTNAVLRNDEKRMKLFTKAQLDAGYDRAKKLQSAMTPLTQSVVLHRGTGAQAFGFPNTNVSFAQLKKLEGKTVIDNGFISTSVVEPTAHGVGFDYATKKPIKVIIRAPEGTPALYVSSATPGYSHENELILAAGTSLRLDSIEPATAADKAKYGSHVEHIVVATVVPSAPHAAAPQAPATPSATPSAAPSSLVNADIGTGVPIKLNTKTIHTATYKHGEIVAVRSLGNMVHQLFWDENKKKFGVRIGSIVSGKWTDTHYATKKAVYDAYKNDKGWYEPLPGSTIENEKLGPGSGGVSAVPTPKVPKITSVDIQLMHGQPPKLPDAEFKQLIANIKYVSPLGEVKLGSQSPTIFKAVAYAVAQHNRNNPNSPQLNLLQALKLLDAKSTPSGQQNSGLYETKVVDWLQTAAGKKNAPAFVQWAEDLAHQPAAPKMLASTTTVKDPYEIGTPSDGVTKFTNMTVATGSTMHAQQRAKYGNWTQEQVHAIQSYTGSGYASVNSALRSGKPNKSAALIQSAMAPATRSFTVYRGSDGLGEAMKGHHTLAELKQLEGKTVSDPAFLSTSVGANEAFSGKKFRLEIEVPEGTPVAYAYTVSSFKAEREMILAAGLKYRVISITPTGSTYGTKYTVRLRVVS